MGRGKRQSTFAPLSNAPRSSKTLPKIAKNEPVLLEDKAVSTGLEDIDSLVIEFAKRPECARLRETKYAAGRGEEISELLVSFLRWHGWNRKGREAYISGDEWVKGEMIDEFVDPDYDFNYQDRRIAGENIHKLVFLDLPSHVEGITRLSIDFTAAQYGYKEFPLIQLLTPDGKWLRGEDVAEYVKANINFDF